MWQVSPLWYETGVCVFTIKITGRTAKTVSYEYMGDSRRSKIRVDDSGEYIQPDRYSMAPVFRAERKIQAKETPAATVEATPAAVVEDAAPSKIVTISQPADDGSVIVMIGQPVERNCVACFPLETGTVVGFVDVPDGVVLRGGVFALVRWAATRTGPSGSACPTFTVTTGGPRTAPRWVCSSADT